MKERLSNLKFVISEYLKLSVSVWIGILAGIMLTLAVFSCGYASAAPVDTSAFCYKWKHYGEAPDFKPTDRELFMFHLGFFLTKHDKVQASLERKTHLDKETIARVITCYEENSPVIVETIDGICNKAIGNELDDNVQNELNLYINWCIQQESK